MQIVLDANILPSGAIAPEGGTLATIIDCWQRDQFGVVLSPPIVAELERTLTDGYFTQRLSPRDIATYLVTVRQTSALIQVTAEVRGVATHPEDDLVLATAVSAKADYLLSGDKKLQRVRTYEGVRIVSPREFRDILERL